MKSYSIAILRPIIEELVERISYIVIANLLKVIDYERIGFLAMIKNSNLVRNLTRNKFS